MERAAALRPMLLILGCAVLGGLMSTPVLLAQQSRLDDLRATAEKDKPVAHFDTWGGKRGALKKGFRFRAQDYPELTGFEVVFDMFDVFPEDRSITRQRRLSNGEEFIGVEISVAITSTDEAQERLMLEAVATSRGFGQSRTVGTDAGVQIGDVNIIGRLAANLPDLGGLVYFARNNVTCFLRHQEGPRNVNVRTLAEKIDARIRALPDQTPAELEALRPQFAEFAVPAGVAPQPGYAIDMALRVSDPSGEGITLLLGPQQNTETTVKDGKVRVVPRGAGEAWVEVVAVNDSLLYSRRRATFTVEAVPRR